MSELRQEPVALAADTDHPYVQQLSFMRDDGRPAAGPALRAGAVLAFLAAAAVNVGLVVQRGGGGAEATGAAIGTLIWPMVAVGIYTLVSHRANQRRRFKVFLFSCLALLLLPAATWGGVRLYAHYVASADIEGLSIEQLQARSENCLRHSDLECAVGLWQRYAELHPQDGAVQARLALALARTGRHAEALKHFEQALALGEGAYDLFAFYAESLAALGRMEEAIDWFYKTLAIAPDLVDVRGRLAKLLLARQRPYEALSLLQAYDVRREAAGRPGYFAAQRMSIEASLARSGAAGADERLLRLPMYGGHYYAPLKLGKGAPAGFLVDTGASVTTISPELLEAAHADYREVASRVELRTADGRKVAARSILLSSVRIGPFEVKDMPAVVCENCQLLLGQSTLSRFDIQSVRRQGMEFLLLRPR